MSPVTSARGWLLYLWPWGLRPAVQRHCCLGSPRSNTDSVSRGLGAGSASGHVFFNGRSTRKSVYFILKPGLPAFLGLSRDPAEVGHCTGQQLPRGGRQPRSCMRMYTPVTVPTMLCHLTGFSPEVTGVGVMAEIGLVEREISSPVRTLLG